MKQFARVAVISLALVAIGTGEVLSQDVEAAEEQARSLLVEAIRNAQEAQGAEGLAERLAALDAADAALTRIETEFATTDTGIKLITGDTFGAFDPASVNTALEAARTEAEVENRTTEACRDGVTPACVIAELEADAGVSPDDNVTPFVGVEILASADGPDWGASAIKTAAGLEANDAIAIYSSLWLTGRLPEMLSLYAALPESSATRQEWPSYGALLNGIAELYGMSDEPATRIGLRRLMAQGEAPERLVFGIGGQEEIQEHIAALDDPVARIRELIDNGTLDATSRQAAFAAVALERAGHSDAAMDIALPVDPESQHGGFGIVLAGFSPDTAIDYAVERHARGEVWCDTIFWKAVRALPTERVPDLAERLPGNPLLSGCNNVVRDVALSAGLDGRQDLRDLVMKTPEGDDSSARGVRSTFMESYDLGARVADEGSAEDILGALGVLSGDATDAVLPVVMENLVERGRPDVAGEVVRGLETLGSRSSPGPLAAAAAAAYIGDLDAGIEMIRNGEIEWYEYEMITKAYRAHLDAVRRADEDEEIDASALERLFDAVPDPGLAFVPAYQLAFLDDEGASGHPEMVYRALPFADPERRSGILHWVLPALLVPNE
ncbi:hypothetical protein [uncultured Jannaschia sp.]|uniref:hypothetical protein n=1 Tax=uncultured Jannaschia sp. TaxID=293347 RepID=UPI00262B612A|nr:hypothetical protein [uncultured Jannaschia sp.]